MPLQKTLKLAPILLLALLAVGTSLQVGCSGGTVGDGKATDDAVTENDAGGNPACGGYGYGYGYGYGSYGYGCGGR